jgi:hypothetical protein
MARTVQPAVPVALGSLTQPGAREATCRTCGSERVTRIAMQLTDGSTVDFTSCLACENRSWEHDGRELSRQDVLARTQRT